MESVALKGEARAISGKKELTALRKSGKVPAVLYGGKENVIFSVSVQDFNKLIYTPNVSFIDLNIDGKKYKAIIQVTDFHPVTDIASHIDFLELSDDKAVTMQVPVRTQGNPPGVVAGGKLQTKLNTLKVKALPAQMPNEIMLDVSKLNIGDSIKVGDIALEGVTFLNAENAVAVTVRTSRAAISASDEQGKAASATPATAAPEKAAE